MELGDILSGEKEIIDDKLVENEEPDEESEDMTDEEYLSSTKFRSDVLAKAVVNPKLTAEEWRTKVDYGMLTAVYEVVNRVLTEADDATLFQ